MSESESARVARIFGKPGVVAAGLALAFGLGAASVGDNLVADPDEFWLAAVGRDIAATHAMPHFNAYSYADGARPWVLHEGLFAILDYAGLNALGPGFFILLGLVAGCTTAFLGMLWIFRMTRSPLAGALSGLVLVTAACNYFVPRPAYASLPFVVAMVSLVMRPGWTRGRAAAAVGLELVWTSAHGGFPIGLLLIAAGAFDDGRSREETRAWLGTALVASAATLLNPNGWRLHWLVLWYLRGADPTADIIQTHILGFANILKGYGDGFIDTKAFFALLVVGGVAVRAVIRRKRLARAAVVLLAVTAALLHVRNVILAIVLGAVLLYEAADEAATPKVPPPRGKHQALWLALAVVLPGFVVGAVKWSRAFATRPPLAWIHKSLGGERFVRLVEGLPDGAHVFAPFKPSATALWYDAERGVKVLYDPRNDCYSAEVARGALELDWKHRPPVQGDASTRQVANFLERYGTDYAVVPAGVIARDLSSDAAWETWRRNGDWVAFHRKAPAPETPPIPAPTPTPPAE